MAITQDRRAAVESKPESVIDFAHEQGVKIVDLRFTDLFGTWQHFSIPLRELSPSIFREGIGFDGSSIRGFQHIHESDMNLMPDPATAFVDPLSSVRTMVLVCDVFDPPTGLPYSRDPRFIAKKAEA